MREFDHATALKLLDLAQEDFHSQYRVTRRTFAKLSKALPHRMYVHMLNQLAAYQHSGSTMKAVAFLADLPAWKRARVWAMKGGVACGV